MSNYIDSYDALDALVNCYVESDNRKEAEKLIKQDLDKLEKLEKENAKLKKIVEEHGLLNEDKNQIFKLTYYFAIICRYYLAHYF